MYEMGLGVLLYVSLHYCRIIIEKTAYTITVYNIVSVHHTLSFLNQ